MTLRIDHDFVREWHPSYDIEKGSILPNHHGEGNAGQCWCVGTEQQIFDRLGRGSYRVRQYRY